MKNSLSIIFSFIFKYTQSKKSRTTSQTHDHPPEHPAGTVQTSTATTFGIGREGQVLPYNTKYHDRRIKTAPTGDPGRKAWVREAVSNPF